MDVLQAGLAKAEALPLKYRAVIKKYVGEQIKIFSHLAMPMLSRPDKILKYGYGWHMTNTSVEALRIPRAEWSEDRMRRPWRWGGMDSNPMADGLFIKYSTPEQLKAVKKPPKLTRKRVRAALAEYVPGLQWKFHLILLKGLAMRGGWLEDYAPTSESCGLPVLELCKAVAKSVNVTDAVVEMSERLLHRTPVRILYYKGVHFKTLRRAGRALREGVEGSDIVTIRAFFRAGHKLSILIKLGPATVLSTTMDLSYMVNTVHALEVACIPVPLIPAAVSFHFCWRGPITGSFRLSGKGSHTVYPWEVELGYSLGLGAAELATSLLSLNSAYVPLHPTLTTLMGMGAKGGRKSREERHRRWSWGKSKASKEEKEHESKGKAATAAATGTSSGSGSGASGGSSASGNSSTTDQPRFKSIRVDSTDGPSGSDSGSGTVRRPVATPPSSPAAALCAMVKHYFVARSRSSPPITRSALAAYFSPSAVAARRRDAATAATLGRASRLPAYGTMAASAAAVDATAHLPSAVLASGPDAVAVTLHSWRRAVLTASNLLLIAPPAASAASLAAAPRHMLMGQRACTLLPAHLPWLRELTTALQLQLQRPEHYDTAAAEEALGEEGEGGEGAEGESATEVVEEEEEEQRRSAS